MGHKCEELKCRAVNIIYGPILSYKHKRGHGTVKIPLYSVIFASSFLCCNCKIREEVNLRTVVLEVFESSGCIRRPLTITEVVKADDHGVREPRCLRTREVLRWGCRYVFLESFLGGVLPTGLLQN